MKQKKLEGNDVNIEIALQEYGLAWIEGPDSYDFYYGINHDGEEYNRFDVCTIDKDIDFKTEFDWVNWENINSYIGMNFDDMTFTQKITDLFSYYGYECVFGSSYFEGLTYHQVIDRGKEID